MAVVAYHPEAIEEANFLAEVCSKVYFIQEFSGPVHHLSTSVEQVSGKTKAIIGESKVARLTLDDRDLAVDGVFIIRTTTPVTQLIPGLALAEHSVKVDRSMATNIPGIFAAGDCTGQPWQLAKAVGEGNVAGLSAASYVDNL